MADTMGLSVRNWAMLSPATFNEHEGDTIVDHET